MDIQAILPQFENTANLSGSTIKCGDEFEKILQQMNEDKEIAEKKSLSRMRSRDKTISSWTDIVSGSSISVYKTQDFNPANPVYKVKTWDKAGNVTEQTVDVSKVSPKNCTTAEMYAFTAHLKECGKGSFEDTVLKAVAAKAVNNAEQRSAGSWSFSEKTDWVKVVNDIMQSEYRYGDLKGCMEWKKFLEFLEK